MAEVKVDEGSLRATHDAYGNPYTKDQIYIRLVMLETAHLEGIACYKERAKRYLEAEQYDIHLPAFVLEWARKVLEA